MTTIDEKSLRFEFGSSWEHVHKYDDHRIYSDGIGKLHGPFTCEKCQQGVTCQSCSRGLSVGTKAVDIIGLYNKQVYFIEIKDFRHYRIENKKRLTKGHLAFEVALKIRDTLAGLLGTMYRNDEWKRSFAPLLNQPPKIVLWLEEDLPQGAQRTKGGPDWTISGDLKKRLDWLTPRVQLANRENPLPDVNVVQLPKPG